MKDKYVDERYGFWYVFGKHPDGSVDIVSADTRSMDFGPVQPDVADSLVAEHNRTQAALVKMAQAFAYAAPHSFMEFWRESA